MQNSACTHATEGNGGDAEQNSSASTTNAPPCCCCCCCCGKIICSIFVLFIILLICYLLVNGNVPKSPNFQVGSLSLTNFTSCGSVTGAWQITFLTRNCHKKIMAVNYGPLRAIVYYQNAYLSDSQILPFRQDPHSKTALDVSISAFDVNVGQFFLNGMKKEMMEEGSIGFKVVVIGSIKYEPSIPLIKRHFFTGRRLYITCDRLQVNISSNTSSSSGELVGGPGECYD
ncbi:hypothetical protein RIF29_31686 [Crotalaria pallida]|uniref:Late embryogenesis abundant protein LEA-2 subgroup domain-containing protein n=1 Tax=Crotalaria pallida TaxID=3830 RepID=A0AAN9HVE6_CROPI